MFTWLLSSWKPKQKVYFMDCHQNDIHHINFMQEFKDSYDLFGVLFKDTKYLQTIGEE